MTTGPTAVEAVVMTAGRETRYRRAGHGRAVLLLVHDDALFTDLARDLRVVEPLGPDGGPSDPEWHAWIQGLVDGLGLDRPALVVDPGAGSIVRRLTATDPDRFGPVVDSGTAAAVRARLVADSGGGTEDH